MNRVTTNTVAGLMLITLFSFTDQVLNTSDSKELQKIIKTLWGNAIASPIDDLLLDKERGLYEFHDYNNDLYKVLKEDIQEGLICVRTNIDPPFSNWEGIDRSNPLYRNKKNAFEPIKYAITLDKDLSVKNVKILEFKSEYGIEIKSKSWLKQFNGYEGKQLTYGKNIDAITGATISANELTEDFEASYKALRVLYGKISEGPN